MRSSVALLLCSFLSVLGCSRTRSSGSADAAAEASVVVSGQRPLPLGMLAPEAAPPAAAASAPAARLRVGRDVTTGEWIELQPAPSGESPRRTTFEHFRGASLFLTLDAMTLLHGAFARALSGFDAFSPHLFDPGALGRLVRELATLRKEWNEAKTAEDGRAQWGERSSFVRSIGSDADWSLAQSALSATIDDVTRMADERAKRGECLWVMATR